MELRSNSERRKHPWGWANERDAGRQLKLPECRRKLAILWILDWLRGWQDNVLRRRMIVEFGQTVGPSGRVAQ